MSKLTSKEIAKYARDQVGRDVEGMFEEYTNADKRYLRLLRKNREEREVGRVADVGL